MKRTVSEEHKADMKLLSGGDPKIPIKVIEITQIAFEDFTPVVTKPIFLSIYDNCLTSDAFGKWQCSVAVEVEDEITKKIRKEVEVREILIDNRIVIDRYTIEAIQRMYDNEGNDFQLYLDGRISLYFGSKEEADRVYDLLCAWRWGI